MKTCPHCNQENPKGRIFCIHCGRRLEEEKTIHKILNSFWGIAGGIVLLLFDTDMDLALGHLIPIPYALSFVGIGVILFNLENIINIASPASMTDVNSAEQPLQTVLDSPARLLRAILLGLIAGSVSAGVWYGLAVTTGYHFGVLAILVGWLVGKFMAIGFREKGGFLLQLTSAIMCLSILTFNEYFIMHYFLTKTLLQKGYEVVPLLLPLDSTIMLLSEAWRNEPVSILFWILALGLAFTVPRGLYINKPIPKSDSKIAKPLQ